MLDLTNPPKPKYLWQRIFNFVLVTFLLIISPVFLQLAALQKSVGLQILLVILMVIVYSLVGYYAYILLKGTTQKAVFHKINVRNWRHIWHIVGIFALMLLLEIMINIVRVIVVGTTTTENQEAIESLTKHFNVTMVGMMIYGVILAPVVEEIVFRGLVVNYFFRRSWWWASVILSGVLFAFPHMGTIPTNIADILSYLIYTTMGMVLAYTYKKSGQLQDSIAVHALNNFITMIPLLLMAIIEH